jgi:hypothetical protein
MSPAKITARPPIELGTYRHYKGNLYRVVDLVCHSETLEWMVLYAPLYEHDGMPDRWVRPYAMFVEEIEFKGKKMPRFEHIDKHG